MKLEFGTKTLKRDSLTLFVAFYINAAAAQAEIVDGEYHRIQNLANDTLLDIKGNNQSDGTEVWTYPANNTSAQRFKIFYSGTSDTGLYYIKSDSGMNVTARVSQRETMSAIGANGEKISTENINITDYPSLMLTRPISRETSSDQFGRPNQTMIGKITFEHQVWKITPSVVNPEVYTIESLAFNERRALQADAKAQGDSGSVRVVPYTGGIRQQWAISAIKDPDTSNPPQPNTREIPINMSSQVDSRGVVSYAIQNGPQGAKIVSIRRSSILFPLKFPKIVDGYTVADCEDPAKVEILSPGATFTPTELESIYGSPSPPSPNLFIACGPPQSVIPTFTQIQVTFTDQ